MRERPPAGAMGVSPSGAQAALQAPDMSETILDPPAEYHCGAPRTDTRGTEALPSGALPSPTQSHEMQEKWWLFYTTTISEQSVPQQ